MLLFVDDEVLAIRPLIELLKEDGYAVEVRNRADRALEALRNIPNLRCAVIDIMMPAPAEWGDDTLGGMATGLVLARKMREINGSLPIIFLTGGTNAAVGGALRDFPAPSRHLRKLYLRGQSWIEVVREMAGPPDSPGRPGPA